ncbi:hypothetical protein Tco_0616451 [Tanacetum coccineum]
MEIQNQQYLQHEHYALWEVIEFGNSYKAPPEEPGKGVEGSAKKKGRTVAITTKDMQKRRNDVKARTTPLLALPDEHQLRFSKYDNAKELWEAILKTFGGNEATKKKKKNQLKQQYGNFKVEGSRKSEVPTASVQTASVQVSTASIDVTVASLSYDNVCAYIATQSNGSQIKYKDITQIDDDDIEEMDIKWNLALLSMRADRECKASRSQDRGKRESYKKDPKVEEPAPKALIAIDGIRWDWSYMADEDENHALMADDVVPTEFALIAMSSSSSSSDNERDVEIRDNKIESLKNELEELKKEKESIDHKLAGFDLSWTSLPEFVDDTVNDYTRPTPSVDVSNDVRSDLDGNNTSIFEQGETSCSNMSRPMIKFMKESDCPNAIKVNNTEKVRKPTVKYAEMYMNTSKSPRFPLVEQKFPLLASNVPFYQANSTAKPTGAADLGNKGKAVKALARWI